MTQRGRKSFASTLVFPLPTGNEPKLTAPSFLTKQETSLFNETVAANPHLTMGDGPLLSAYVQGLAKCYKLARRGDVTAWEKCLRATLSAATRLRLTPQSSLHPDTAARKKSNQVQGPKPWLPHDRDEVEEDEE